MSSAAQTSRSASEHQLAIARGLRKSLDIHRGQVAARQFLELPDATDDQLREALSDVIRASEAALREEKTMRVQEARVTGNPPVPGSPSSQTGAEAAQNEAWGGPNAAAAGMRGGLTPAAVAAGIEMSEPPNLRRATDWERCGNCVFFNRMCNLYGINRPPHDEVHRGGWPVTRDDLCDSHTTLTPAAQQSLSGAQRYTDRYLREGRELAEAVASGDGFAMTRGRARLDVAAHHLEELGILHGVRAAFDATKHPRGRAGEWTQTVDSIRKMKPGDRHNVAHGVNIERDPKLGYTVLHHGEVTSRHGDDMRGAASAAHIHAENDARMKAEHRRRDGTKRHDASNRAATFRAMNESEGSMGRELSEVKSSAYPGLDRSPKKNWVDKAGGLPRYIERIAKHLHYEKGKEIGHAIAIAVNVVKKMCASGDTNFPGKQNVNAKSRAQACAAVAQWEAKKGKAKAKSVAEAADYPFAKSLELFEAAFKPIPPSWGFIERTLLEIAVADGADWFDGLNVLDEAEEIIEEYGLEEAVARELVEMNVLARLGHHFDPARHPRSRSGKFRDVLGQLDRAAKGRSGGKLGSFGGRKPSTTQPRSLSDAEMAFPAHVKEHVRNGRLSIDKSFRLGEVPTRMKANQSGGHDLLDSSGRKVASGQRGAVGHLWAANHGALTQRSQSDAEMGFGNSRSSITPSSIAKASDADLRRGLARFPNHEHAESMRRRLSPPERAYGSGRGRNSMGSRPSGADADQGGIGRTASASVKTVEQHFADDNRARVLRRDPLGARQQGTGSAPHDDLKVDVAIGQTLANFPNVKDWKIDGPISVKGEPRHWILDVELADGKKHKIRVDEDGNVSQVKAPASKVKPVPAEIVAYAKKQNAAAEATKQAAYAKIEADYPPLKTPSSGYPSMTAQLPDLSPPGNYVPTGDWNVVSHMAPGTVYKGADGHLYKHHGDDYIAGKKGPVKGAHIENLETGTHKTVPYFAIHGKEYEIHALKGTFTPKPAGSPTSASDAFGALLKSVEGQHGSLSSVSGKNVVITGAIPGYTQHEVQSMIKAAGGIPHDKWHASADVLVTGEKVGKTKINAAAKKGIPVIPWNEFKSLVEAELGEGLRLVRARARLEETTDPLEVSRLRARVRVLEEKTYDAGERRANATVGDDSYPIGDAEHAKQALIRLDQGGLSNAEKAKVIAKAARYLGRSHALVKKRKKELA